MLKIKNEKIDIVDLEQNGDNILVTINGIEKVVLKPDGRAIFWKDGEVDALECIEIECRWKK